MTQSSAVRIGGPVELLEVLPRLMGFEPTQSAVLVALRPPRGRIALTLRVDLPVRRHESGCARLLATHARRAGATTAVLVVYDERPASGGTGRWRGSSLAREVRRALRAHGLRLTDAVAVRAGRWRSLLCADEGCCPVDGRPLADGTRPSPALAALVAEGATVAPSRAVLEDRLAAPSGADAIEAARRCVDVAARLARRVDRGTPRERVRAETGRLFVRALATSRAGHPLHRDLAARLVVGLVDVRARDSVLSRAADRGSDDLLRLLTELVPRAAPPFDAPVLTALAWVAYARGDGTVANIAVERALVSDPDYAMARLIASGLAAGLHPRQVRAVSRAVRRDVEQGADAGTSPGGDTADDSATAAARPP